MPPSERTNLLKDTLRDDCLDSLRSACFIVKEELPLPLFSKLLSLEERHSVEIGTTYQNCNYGGQLIDYISEKLANDFKVELTNANFQSVFTDRSTDASITKKKVIFTIYLKSLLNREDHIKICTSYLDF